MKMEKEDSVSLSKSNIRNSFAKVDAIYPNFAYDFLLELLKASGTSHKNVNLNEMILRAEKFSTSEGLQTEKLLKYNQLKLIYN